MKYYLDNKNILYKLLMNLLQKKYFIINEINLL